MSGSLKSVAPLLLLAIKATATLGPNNAHIAATSWGSPRVDVLGIAPDKTIWHKYDIGAGQPWQPTSGFENMNATAFFYPSAVSWGQNRLDYFHIGKESAAHHKYWDGSQWNPPGKYSERLEGKFSSGLAVSSWGPNRLDIVGRTPDNTYIHKAYAESSWIPSITDWEEFGGNFSSAPAIVSWGPGRLDIFGISAETGSVLHKYWNGATWVDWEDLGGGPFVGDLVASSWGEGRFDIWAAAEEDGQLNHKFWDGYNYQGWEKMGGNFKTAPTVVHWDVGKIDIVGLFDGSDDDTHYHSKYFDGNNWGPGIDKWYDKKGDFAGQPALVANKGTNFLYVLGVGNDGKLYLQVYDGVSWQPQADGYFDLGDTQNPYSSAFVDWTVQLDL